MRRASLSVAITGLLLVACGVMARCQSMEELEVDHALTLDFVTPHTDWGQPYAGGKTRVLFVTTGHGTVPRECVELMQRFDIEAKAAFYARIVDSPKTHWHGDETGERRMLNLLQEKWDCYVLMGVALDKFSAEQQYKLLAAVVNGSGLVMMGVTDKRVLQDKNRLQPVPGFLARGPVGEAFTIGHGRGIRLPDRPNIDYYEGWEADYDWWQERLGRAVLWAAGKAPRLALELSVPAGEIAANQERAGLTVTSAGTLVGDKPVLEVCVRRPADAPVAFPRVPLVVGTPVALTIPALPDGAYHADARVISAAGVEAWATVPFAVTSSRKVAEVKLYQEWGEVGDHIAGAVTLAGPPLPAEKLRVSLLDRRRRELARRDLVATNDPVEFDFAIPQWMPMLVTVEARLLRGEQEAARASKYFRVTRRSRGQFNFLMWDVPRGTLAPYAEASLAQHAVTLQLSGGNPPVFLAAYDVAWVPYTTRVLSSRDANGIMKPFCWNDEAAVTKHVTALAEKYVPSRQHGVFVYSLGDENETLGACLSPHCARAYREYLREVYGSLEALNKSWGTAFAEWDKAGLAKEDDSEEAVSLRDKNYPRWFDRQAFKSYNYVKFCVRHGSAYDTIDPQAKTGFEGAGTFAGGDDLDLIVRSLKFWSPYPGTADEVVRSIAPRELPRANWMGYTKDADSLLQKYWRMVTRGMDAVWWWRWDCIGAFHGWLAPDLRPYPAVAEILKDTQVMRDGLGDLLLKSEMQDDGVAMLYSYPSVFAHKLEEGATFAGYEASHTAAHSLVRESRLQFRYVTDRMLRLGEFDPGKCRLLILPRAEAIGDAEAELMRKFVAQGGTLVADVRPGLYDEHCKPRGKGVLDDLFGIEREASAAGKLGTVEPGGYKLKVDPSVRLKDAEAWGRVDGTPVGIVRKVGKGTAILLNFDLASFPRLQGQEVPPEAEAVAAGLFAGAGVAPALRVTDAAGKRTRGLEVTRWQDGAIQIISLFREAGRAEEATVTLPAVCSIYDLRNRKAVGASRSFTTTLLPSRASFFALTTRPAPRPEVRLSQATVAPGAVAKVAVSVPGAEGLQAVRIRAQAQGAELEWLSRNLVVGERPQELDLPIAFNDPRGEVEISATELFTNQATTARLTVK